MFEEHMRHCEFLNKPYSNIARSHKLNKKLLLKPIARNLIKFGFGQSAKFYLSRQSQVKKLSGLHFMKTKPYFPEMLKIREDVVGELNLLAEGKSKKYNLCSFNNESLLYDMMMECGFGELEEAEPGYNIATDGGNLSYRPHHGIHLGIFRHSAIMQNEKSVIDSSEYRNFYREFEKLSETDEYKKLFGEFSEYLKTIIKNMQNYYRGY